MRIYDIEPVLKSVIERTKTVIKESRTPDVGIFWIIEGNLILDTVSYNSLSVCDFDGTKDYPRTHYEYWENMKRSKIPFAIENGWLDFLRGRVIYITQDKKFLIITDISRFTDENKNQVVEEFNLPKNTEVVHNEHYEEGYNFE